MPGTANQPINRSGAMPTYTLVRKTDPLVPKNHARKSDRLPDDDRSTGLKALFATLLFALFVSPIGHGCSISHRHGDDDEDEEPFRMLLSGPDESDGPNAKLNKKMRRKTAAPLNGR